MQISNIKNTTVKSANKKGFSIIEALVGIAMVSLLAMSLYASINGAVRNMGDAKLRSGAVALANEKMEILRSLEYEKVGTTAGIPRGVIAESEIVSKNGYNYSVNTFIGYVDDPFDGEGLEDPISADYKEASIKISWSASGEIRSVDFYSIFVPKGIETDAQGGTLSISATTTGGEAVAGVSVHIESVDNSPLVDFTALTDISGNLVIPGAPSQKYRISLLKTDYENVRTYPNPPGSPFTPYDADINVTDKDVVMKTFFIDKSADIIVKAVEVKDNSPIEGIEFQVSGGRKIGFDPDTYPVTQTAATNSTGEIMLSDLSQGIYNIDNLSSLGNDSYFYLGCDSSLPISLSPEQVITANFIFADKAQPSLAVTVFDATAGSAIDGAQVRVVGEGFDQSMPTNSGGLAYFPMSADPPVTMLPGTYEINIEASGYQPHLESAVVESLVSKEISLTPL